MNDKFYIILLIIIVSIIFILFISNKYKESYSHSRLKMAKGLTILLVGESFRRGGQGTRRRNVPESYDEQIEACKSHKRLCDNISTKMPVEIFICSYNTKWKDDIDNIYKDYYNKNKSNIFYDHLIGNKNLINNALKHIDKTKNLLILRIDLLLKDLFFKVFEPNSPDIVFPSICWYEGRIHQGYPRVNDMMMFVPSEFLDLPIGDGFCHEGWMILETKLGIPRKRIDTIVETLHDSDSNKDFNPLYKVVNRPESNKWHSEGCTFDKNKDKDKMFNCTK